MDNFFIHGYGTNITSPFQKPLDKNKGFAIHGGENNLVVFDWSIPCTFSLLEGMNPRSYLSLYQKEFQKMEDVSVQKKLCRQLHAAQPKTLFAHSLGCAFLLQYIQNFDLPLSITQIVFLQADCDADFQIRNKNLVHRVQSKKVTIVNYYCPWDQALVTSSVFHHSLRAGLVGCKNSYVENFLLPATKGPNLHTSCLTNTFLQKHCIK